VIVPYRYAGYGYVAEVSPQLDPAFSGEIAAQINRHIPCQFFLRPLCKIRWRSQLNSLQTAATTSLGVNRVFRQSQQV